VNAPQTDALMQVPDGQAPVSSEQDALARDAASAVVMDPSGSGRNASNPGLSAPGPAPQPASAGRELRWKPHGLLAGIVVAGFAIGIQYLAMQGAVLAGLLAQDETTSDLEMMLQAAAWAATPFLVFSILIEPLVRETGSRRAVVFGLVLSVLGWVWAGFEAWRAAHGITPDSVMANNGIYSSALIMVLPLPLLLAMALIGRFLADDWWPPARSGPATSAVEDQLAADLVQIARAP
jgi:hypothetical protein